VQSEFFKKIYEIVKHCAKSKSGIVSKGYGYSFVVSFGCSNVSGAGTGVIFPLRCKKD
jgi:hypothetical protein